MNADKIGFMLACALFSAAGGSGLIRADDKQAQPTDHPAALSRLRPPTTRELLEVQKKVFSDLFQRPWQEEHWEYTLDEPFKGEGTYPGTNQYGQAFEFAVRFLGRVDLKHALLRPEDRQWAEDHHLALAGVIGELRHGETRITVFGTVVTMRDEHGADRSRFWLTSTCRLPEPVEEPEPPPP